MKILVLGGTLFLGREIVQQALDAGDEVTLFNRGKTNPGLFPEAENLLGNRDTDLSLLTGRSFDAVIDTSAYYPRQVAAVAEAVGPRISHYTFVSSIAVYADHSTVGEGETGKLATVKDLSDETLGPNYGGFKALCEETLNKALPGRVHNVRPGLIVGPHDNTGRFSYWVDRIAAGGRVLAPEPKDQPVQFIDVRDLASWILRAATKGVSGSFNAVGTRGTYTMETMLTEMRTVSESDAVLDWVSAAFLLGEGVKPWTEIPLWMQGSRMASMVGFLTRDTSEAQSRGLTTRALSDTVKATLGWLRQGDHPPNTEDFGIHGPSAGLSTDRERELLEKWDQR